MPKKIYQKKDGYYAEYKDGYIELLMTNEEYEEQNKLYPEDKDFLKAQSEDKINEYIKSIGIVMTREQFKAQFPDNTYRA